jgi:general secretion pathway protein F
MADFPHPGMTFDFVQEKIKFSLDALPFGRIKTSTLAAMTGQLALMLRTGTPLLDSVEALQNQTRDEKLYDVLGSVKNEISGGATLGNALRAHPRIFNGFYVNAVDAGETNGLLADVFTRLEDFLRKRVELRSNIITAMIYPAVIAVVAFIAVTCVMIFVLPNFIRIFEKANVLLPLPTRMLLATSQFMSQYWYVFLLAMFVGPMVFSICARTARGKRMIDYFMLHCPGVAGLTAMIETSLMLRTLGTLLGSGVSLTDALAVARSAARNSYYCHFMGDVLQNVTQGGTLSSTFESSELMSPAVKTMVSTGEATGSLALVMKEVSNYLDVESDRNLKRLSALIEPGVIILMGGVVAFIALSILMPLFQMSALAGRH